MALAASRCRAVDVVGQRWRPIWSAVDGAFPAPSPTAEHQSSATFFVQVLDFLAQVDMFLTICEVVPFFDRGPLVLVLRSRCLGRRGVYPDAPFCPGERWSLVVRNDLALTGCSRRRIHDGQVPPVESRREE